MDQINTPAPTEIMRTSLAARGPKPGEVTVMFNRWTVVGDTAYQKNQAAGFPRDVADRIIQGGAAREIL